MNLIDENIEKESEEKQKKVVKIIVGAIVILIITAILILVIHQIKVKNTLTFSIDNENQKFSSDLFLMSDSKKLYTSDDGQIYISVKKLASMLNVGYYNDEYKIKGEDTTKCFIKTENEYTSYISDSPNIYKVIDLSEIQNNQDNQKNNNGNNKSNETAVQENDLEYEYFTINNGVKYVNNEIYASKSAIELGFNVSISYDAKNKSVKIYTLDALMKAAKSKGVSNVVEQYENNYYNKKLLKYGYVLVRDPNNNDYGITNYVNYQNGNYVVSCKYSEIKFVESLNSVIVTTSEDNGQGLLSLESTGNAKKVVEPIYQYMKQLSEDGSLYLVKENNRYGVVKITKDEGEVEAKTVVKSAYEEIGITDNIKYDDMSNKYIINNKYIPVKLNNKWGIISTEGRILIVPQYDHIGCAKNENGKPVIVLPELREGIDVIVFGNDVPSADNKTTTISYKMIKATTNEQIGMDASSIYSVYENNKKEYYMSVILPNQSVTSFNIYNVYLSRKPENSITQN